MATDPHKLRQIELCRLLNSTPLGEVIKESGVRNHRNQAGLSIGTHRKVHLLRYVAWLVQQRHEVRGEPAKLSTILRPDSAESIVALVEHLERADRPGRLKPKHYQAIAALYTEPTHKAAAESIGVTPNTLCRWLRDPDFAAVYHQAGLELHDAHLKRTQAASGLAVDTLIFLVGNARRESDRLRASRTLLDRAERSSLRMHATPHLMPTGRFTTQDVVNSLSDTLRQVQQMALPVTLKSKLLQAVSKSLLKAMDTQDDEARWAEYDDLIGKTKKKPKRRKKRKKPDEPGQAPKQAA